MPGIPGLLHVQDADDKCLCRPGESVGVKPKQLKALEHIEVWAACDEKDEAYGFDCNHIRIEKGATKVFPTHPVSLYDREAGLHAHVRRRNGTPHEVSGAAWREMELTSCGCPK